MLAQGPCKKRVCQSSPAPTIFSSDHPQRIQYHRIQEAAPDLVPLHIISLGTTICFLPQGPNQLVLHSCHPVKEIVLGKGCCYCVCLCADYFQIFCHFVNIFSRPLDGHIVIISSISQPLDGHFVIISFQPLDGHGSADASSPFAAPVQCHT